MSQTKEGAQKSRARKSNTPLRDLQILEKHNFKWCYKCKFWNPRSEFHFDNSRHDGLSTICHSCRRVKVKKPRGPRINPKTGKPGPESNPARHGDKTQARQRVVLAVRNKEIPKAIDLPCKHCGHIFNGNMRHEYHHHKGYGADHFLDVIPLCRTCHGIATSQEYVVCGRGHEMSGANAGITSEGRRFCRECRRIRDRKKVRPPGYWKSINDARRKSNKKGGVAHG